MRKWHRWISVFFGVFLLWISITGVLSQIGTLVNNGGFEKETAERGRKEAVAAEQAAVPPAQAHDDDDAAKPAVPGAASAAFVCPDDMICRPKPAKKPGQWNVGLLHHLHSGEQFGPLGVVISLLSGLAMLFFSFSGLWMYIQMWRNRAGRSQTPRWFWK